MKKVIICIHGFKTGQYHDFDLFEKFCASNPELHEGEVCKVHLYDMEDKKSFKCRRWKKVALQAVEPYANDDYEIYLIGYSMGAGIACYVASKIKVTKLILIAPLFHLLGSRLLGHSFKLYFKNLKMKLFHRKKLKKMQRFRNLQKKIVPFSLPFNIALSIKRYKKYVKRVNCETLVMLGLEDDYAPLRSATFAFKKVRTNKKELWFIDNLNHLFIFSKELAPEVFVKMLSFIKGNPITTYYK